MSVAKIIELSAESPKSFEDAIQNGISRASKTITRHQIGLGEGATRGDRQRQGVFVSHRPKSHVRAGLT